MLSSISIVAVVFAAWELVESKYFREADYVSLHYLYITRGIATSLLLAVWAAWYVLRQRRWREEELRLSREHYRGLLEASPGAVALYDASLLVSEWNATAERLYSFSKEEVVGKPLPTIPPGKETELRCFLQRVQGGEPILDVETVRRDKHGAAFEVQFSLLPFTDATGQRGFLEVTSDIRERVRLREKLFEIEKLASMGKMAAGTAHHLNTPLAAMLLRVQMMRERAPLAPYAADLERLEASIRFCQQFVQRLLEFSRRPPIEKRPEEIARTIQSVTSFLAPLWLTKRARVSFDLNAANGERVLADRNQLEAMFTILLSNALDAISPEGTIGIRCLRPSAEWIEIQIADNGCGITSADLPQVFEPFFTTKGPGKGTGLGLAIARRIAVEHGGSVRLESAPNQGTTAFIQLPLYQLAPAIGGKGK
ncbi:MAG: PAS domain S-box protein [Acidobacteria bacterium]|nr:PAS domain S-box protein [Acidobacteriota bacterium]